MTVEDPLSVKSSVFIPEFSRSKFTRDRPKFLSRSKGLLLWILTKGSRRLTTTQDRRWRFLQ